MHVDKGTAVVIILIAAGVVLGVDYIKIYPSLGLDWRELVDREWHNLVLAALTVLAAAVMLTRVLRGRRK